MASWQRWVRQPQNVWLRRAVFQIHLWTGLLTGLYIVVLSLTGSVMVYRVELVRSFATPRPQFDASAPRRSTAELRAAAQQAYPDHVITRVSETFTRRDPTIVIWLEKGGEKKERLFNPYTGEELGDSTTAGEWFLLWVANLHDELLLGRNGRFWNGVGSALVTLLAITGAIIWWPGISRWRRSITPSWKAAWPRFSWDLHSALGFWFFAFVAIWGVSGIYLGIPSVFTTTSEYLFGPPPESEQSLVDVVLAWLTRLHFGRWRNEPLQALWAIAGLVPALLFVTAVVMWWNRVVRRMLRKESATATGADVA